MILSKLNLINRKISDFLKIDINGLIWIIVSTITTFIVIGNYLNHSYDLKEKHNNHFTTEQVKTTQIPIKKTFVADTQIDDNLIFELIFWTIYIWIGLLVVGRNLFCRNLDKK